jgi:hypothetical protein
MVSLKDKQIVFWNSCLERSSITICPDCYKAVFSLVGDRSKYDSVQVHLSEHSDQSLKPVITGSQIHHCK